MSGSVPVERVVSRAVLGNHERGRLELERTPDGRPGRKPPAGFIETNKAHTLAETDATPGLRLTGVSKAFGSTQVVKEVDLDVPRGAFVVILGPAGIEMMKFFSHTNG